MWPSGNRRSTTGARRRALRKAPASPSLAKQVEDADEDERPGNEAEHAEQEMVD
jgi:hypothetical protein